MTKRRLILAAAVLFAIVAVTVIGMALTGKPVFFEMTTARFRVIRAEYLCGTNLVLAQEEPVAKAYRLVREVFQAPVWKAIPSTDFVMNDTVKRYAFAFLCEGQHPTNNEVARFWEQTDAVCIDDTGHSNRFSGLSTVNRNDNRFWVIWSIPRFNFSGLPSADESPDFRPREFHLYRKSDGHELASIKVPH